MFLQFPPELEAVVAHHFPNEPPPPPVKNEHAVNSCSHNDMTNFTRPTASLCGDVRNPWADNYLEISLTYTSSLCYFAVTVTFLLSVHVLLTTFIADSIAPCKKMQATKAGEKASSKAIYIGTHWWRLIGAVLASYPGHTYQDWSSTSHSASNLSGKNATEP